MTKTPKGKLPVIEDDGKTVCDSVFIVDYLKKEYGDTLDADMSASDRAIAVAFGRMLEESFYWYLVQMRYRKDESFKVYDPIWVEFLDFVPPEQRTGPVEEFRERILHEFFWCGKGPPCDRRGGGARSPRVRRAFGVSRRQALLHGPQAAIDRCHSSTPG